MGTEVQPTSNEEVAVVDATTFLESLPPNSRVIVSGLLTRSDRAANYPYLTFPDITLHCDDELCGGARVFGQKEGDRQVTVNLSSLIFAIYQCKNCEDARKVFALRITPTQDLNCVATKLGELPAFGPHVPSRVISLIGPDKETFLSGRRAENQGMGIGAFAYYRRVVERQQKRIIEEIGKVANRLGASAETKALFARAIEETQFSTAIDLIRPAFPPALIMAGGHNPLSVLHSALSEGVHDLTDAECLELATDIRLVLTDLAERISTALKDDAELRTAVSRLLSKNAAKSELKTKERPEKNAESNISKK